MAGSLEELEVEDLLQEISKKIYNGSDYINPRELFKKIGTQIDPQGENLEDKKYDLNGNNKIDEDDYKIAIQRENNLPSIISTLNKIAKNLDKPSGNQFTDKKQYIRYLAAMIFSYSDFEKNSLENLVNKAINYSTALANKLFK